MLLKELFRPEDFCLEFAPTDKWTAIEELMLHLSQSGRVEPEMVEELHELVIERERSMSTGMERGIAIPHAAVDGLAEVAACIGVVSSPDGLAFESIDGGPTHLVVLLLIPRAQKLLHIRTLADIAKTLGSSNVRAALREAETTEEAWRALEQGEGAGV